MVLLEQFLFTLFYRHLFPVPVPISHRQQSGDEEPVSHPEETHHPAEGVWWSLSAVSTFLRRPFSILQHPAHGWKGQARGQGGYWGRRGWRGVWGRGWRCGAGWGRGTILLRGQGRGWLQRAVTASFCRLGEVKFDRGINFEIPQAENAASVVTLR